MQGTTKHWGLSSECDNPFHHKHKPCWLMVDWLILMTRGDFDFFHHDIFLFRRLADENKSQMQENLKCSTL